MVRGTDKHIEIPAAVSAFSSRIAAAGGELYVVGGWVRDRLRGADCKDVDFATDLPPARVKEAIEGVGPVCDIGLRFGTVCVPSGDYTFEVTTFRTDVYTPGSRHPEVTHIADITEDLERRDFTINAMALQVAPPTGELIDPFGGAADLQEGIIRTPGPPASRMAEDPLRMMRAVRFCAQLGFEVDGDLLDVIRAQAHLLDDISQERRRDELEKIIVSPAPDRGVRLLADTGLLDRVSPELAAMKDVDQPRSYHRADVLEHTLLTMTYVPDDALLRRSALFHDVGKPPTKVTEPKVMFPEHDKVGVELTRAAMRRLCYSTEDIRKTAFLVRHHMRPIRYESGWSDAAVRRLVRACTMIKDGEVIVPLSSVFALARADIKAGNLEKAPLFLASVDELQKRIDDLGAHHEIAAARSPLDGKDLMELFGRPAGPWLRPLKEHLTHLVVEGRLAPDDKESAANLASEFMDSPADD